MMVHWFGGRELRRQVHSRRNAEACLALVYFFFLWNAIKCEAGDVRMAHLARHTLDLWPTAVPCIRFFGAVLRFDRPAKWWRRETALACVQHSRTTIL